MLALTLCNSDDLLADVWKILWQLIQTEDGRSLKMTNIDNENTDNLSNHLLLNLNYQPVVYTENTKVILDMYSEAWLNQTLNKPESCINQTLNKVQM